MHRIDTDGNVGNLFSEGNPGLGVPATVVGADWLNDLQQNVCNYIESTGATLVKGSYSQLTTAIAVSTAAAAGLTMKSDTPLRWDGAKIYFADNIRVSYRIGTGKIFESKITPASAPSAGEISLSNDECVVMRKNNAGTSPLTLVYQANYASLVAGEWAVVAIASLSATNVGDEIILFYRHDEAPALHYGVAQKVLDVVPYGHGIYPDAKFNLGSERNLLREENALFSQAIINGNMTVSQRGNFTTAITQASGFGDTKFYLDRWKTGMNGVVLTNSSLQRTTATITGHPELTNAVKIIGNTTGSPASGFFNMWQKVEDFALFKSKTVSCSFWMRSNINSDVTFFLVDGVHPTHNATALNTNSGDGVWRHYFITVTISASANQVSVYPVCIKTLAAGATTIPAGGYIEFTGVRLYEGTEELPALIRPYEEELSKCSRYCHHGDGERAYNPGYSIFRTAGNLISTVYANAYAVATLETVVTDIGSWSAGCYHLPKNMIDQNLAATATTYLFDAPIGAVNMNGGDGASRKVTHRDASGTYTHNLAMYTVNSDISMIWLEPNLATNGVILGHLCIEREIM